MRRRFTNDTRNIRRAPPSPTHTAPHRRRGNARSTLKRRLARGTAPATLPRARHVTHPRVVWSTMDTKCVAAAGDTTHSAVMRVAGSRAPVATHPRRACTTRRSQTRPVRQQQTCRAVAPRGSVPTGAKTTASKQASKQTSNCGFRQTRATRVDTSHTHNAAAKPQIRSLAHGGSLHATAPLQRSTHPFHALICPGDASFHQRWKNACSTYTNRRLGSSARLFVTLSRMNWTAACCTTAVPPLSGTRAPAHLYRRV